MPFVWIPNNQTSYVKWEAIPRNWRSKAFQTQGPNSVKNFHILLTGLNCSSTNTRVKFSRTILSK